MGYAHAGPRCLRHCCYFLDNLTLIRLGLSFDMFGMRETDFKPLYVQLNLSVRLLHTKYTKIEQNAARTTLKAD